MKKTASLIIVIFLLLTSCGKSSKLINPPAPPAASGTQAPIEPEIKTQSESEAKSKETTKKQQEETKSSWLQWGPTKFVTKWTLIAAAVYGLYKLTRHVIGEEEWNRIMNPTES